MLQELVEHEAAGVIGAQSYERTEDRLTERNGTRPKLLATKAGDIEVRIPKLRKGSYFPSILEPRRRIDQALCAVVMKAYVHGISTRSVDDLAVALGADSGISKSEVSRICEGLDESVGAFRTRPLDHTAFPYVYLDATYLHVRNKPGKGGQVVSMAVVVATGIAADGSREVLGRSKAASRHRGPPQSPPPRGALSKHWGHSSHEDQFLSVVWGQGSECLDECMDLQQSDCNRLNVSQHPTRQLDG